MKVHKLTDYKLSDNFICNLTPNIGRPLSSLYVYVNIFKHLLLRNHWASQSQISHGASMGWRYESLFNWYRSMIKIADLPIYGKNLKNSSSPETKGRKGLNEIYICFRFPYLLYFFNPTLKHITETSPYSFGNFRKLSLYNCFMPI